jgi:PhzF family phenazine biosynthesis protein
MSERRLHQIDVFAPAAYAGNPLAVVLDADGLDADTMQRFTDWTNLSEVTFLLPPTDPEADYRVRIFCPGRELPFAGHPTLGTCHAWLEAGGVPRGEHIVQECGAGRVRIRREPTATGTRLAFAAPPRRRSGPLDDDDVARLVRGLGIARTDVLDHAWCDNGPNWRAVLLGSAEQVLSLVPDPSVLGALDVGVVAPHRRGGRSGSGWGLAGSPADVDFEVRAFFPGRCGLAEDPVTGSLQAAVAAWLIGAGHAPSRYVARQGTRLGRDGRVYIAQQGDDIWVGGDSITCIRGIVRL